MKPKLLIDTAKQINTASRRPSGESFCPVGHISLDSQNRAAENISLDLPSSGVLWIKTFYVRLSFQGVGAGRAAMDEVERMATQEPLNATVLALDTMHRDDRMREDLTINLKEIPKVRKPLEYDTRYYYLLGTCR